MLAVTSWYSLFYSAQVLAKSMRQETLARAVGTRFSSSWDGLACHWPAKRFPLAHCWTCP
jgi:hypothetical protein